MAWGWNQALATSVGGDTLTSTATLIIVKCIQVAKKIWTIITVPQLGIWTNWIREKKTFKHYIFRSSSDCSIACTVVVFVVNLQLKMLDLKQPSDKYV